MLRSHAMDQRRREVNIKDRDQEHTVYQETSNYKDLHVHGDSLLEKSPALRDEKNYRSGKQPNTIIGCCVDQEYTIISCIRQ